MSKLSTTHVKVRGWMPARRLRFAFFLLISPYLTSYLKLGLEKSAGNRANQNRVEPIQNIRAGLNQTLNSCLKYLLTSSV